jgi:MinD superfamily P-loop ATPase
MTTDNIVIAVASGKGGTGKTTIAVNLTCYLARSHGKAQYIDCDVEEPNGHIFLKPKLTASHHAAVNVPQVIPQRCSGCGKCGEICQYSAIVHLKDSNVLTFEHLCHSCGGCLRVCPADAIKPKPLNIGDIEFGKAGDIDFVHGRLRIGYVRTVSLIKQVKKYIKQDRFTILDVPPGTSCPVVEAVKGADCVLLVTEPTPFGLNDLKLAVGLVREMNLPFAVAVNRYGIGDKQVEEYCKAERIDICLKLPDDRRIAEAYSSGKIIIDVLPEYEDRFSKLYEYLENKTKMLEPAR